MDRYERNIWDECEIDEVCGQIVYVKHPKKGRFAFPLDTIRREDPVRLRKYNAEYTDRHDVVVSL